MTIQLRDGTTAQDPRLGRLRQFDERSRNYSIRATLAAAGIKEPRGYTWRCNLWLDQLSEGSCVGHAWAHELVARPVQAQGVDHEYARRIYHEAQRVDPWPGGAYEGGTPFYEGTSVLAGAQICQRLNHFDEYRWAFGIDDLVLALGYAGPAVLGIDWHRDMAQAEDDGRIRPVGELLGGHAILAYKVQVPTKRREVGKVWLHNSWGQSWGLNGRCYLTYDDLDQLLHQGGEVCIPLKRKQV
jgi:hypothetical protein